MTTVRTPLSPLTEQQPTINFLEPTSIQSLCTSRQTKLKSDEDAIIEARGKTLNSQKEAVRNGLCSMKREWKKMTVREFNEAFGCDIVEMVRRQLEDGEGDGEMKKRVGIAANVGGMSLKTPAVKFAGRPPMTRTVRKGERVVSINGSPVDQFDGGEVFITAKKRKAVNKSESNAPFPISIGVGAGNGETIDLSDPNQRKHLDEEQKAQAMEQIMAMQEQMKNLMANW
ncbi:hypothetical protein ACHAXN_009442 [Cyclotella atomus]